MPEFSYFDLKTARSLLPWLRERLEKLREMKIEVEEKLTVGEKQALIEYTANIKKIIDEITKKGIILRDIDMGLVDFPAIINGRPAFFCWKLDEEDIMYWHYIEEGFVGRKKLTGNEDLLSYT